MTDNQIYTEGFIAGYELKPLNPYNRKHPQRHLWDKGYRDYQQFLQLHKWVQTQSNGAINIQFESDNI